MDEKFKNKIKKWLAFGANYQTGVVIYSELVGLGHPTLKAFKTPKRHLVKILITSLRFRSGMMEANPSTHTPLRKDFTFLDDPSTPGELKILVSNKITSYHRYKELHAKLFECSTQKEEHAVVKNLVENYLENYAIHRELTFYQKNKTLLGEHKIFDEMKRLKALRNSSSKDLYKKKTNIEHNIWRIKKLIKEGKKPHLDFDRNSKIQEYESMLQEINKVLDE